MSEWTQFRFIKFLRFSGSKDADKAIMAEFESGLGLRKSSSLVDRKFGMGFGSFRVCFIGCRFRIQSAFDSYSVACEAFSEQFLCLRFLPASASATGRIKFL